WRDGTEGMVCTIDEENCGDGDDSCCYDTNYEIYYCRDKGGQGTVDDLPAILSQDTIIRGKTDEILKESYFFREETPGMTGSEQFLSGLALVQGKAVSLTWSDLKKCNDDNGKSCMDDSDCPTGIECDEDTGVDGYKVYYGTSKDNFNGESSPIDIVGNKISVELGQDTAYSEVNDLANDKNYYFAVTAYYGDVIDNIESGLSNIIKISIEDTEGPAAPTISPTTPGNGRVTITWEDTSGGEAIS
ncbi:unnamed protein product, partial [marine sediment metagenome]